MAEIVRTGMWLAGGGRGFDILGAEHGVATSLILTDMAPGTGPRLHTHPYAEIWVVIEGSADFTAGDSLIPAAAGDVVYVEPGLPHKFVVTGNRPIRMVCIHEADQFETKWLE